MTAIENIIPLEIAVLCMDCDCITDSRSDCGRCGSSAVVNVRRLLEHTLVQEEAQWPTE
ncbi:MAG: hypothetical protein KGL39_19340 [Patescibacteria group bacterium]|nr:hypothetical protein [Patescibacteria group bacterium]